MTTAEPGDPPIVYHPNGTIDLTMPDGRLALPRPTFGQIKSLIRTLGEVTDAMQIGSNRAVAISRKITAETKVMSEQKPDQGVIRVDTLDRLAELNTEARAAADDSEAATESALTMWWIAVFETLMPEDKRPSEDSWPSFVLDPKLPAQMVAHWRFVPTGPG